MNLDAKDKILVDKVVSALISVTGSGPVSLHEPTFDGNEWLYVKDCLDSTFVSSVGNYVNEFEESLANYTGASFAVAVVNGTAALYIALKLANINPGDEVLIPALSFVATANAVSYCGATPHFVEVEERTLGIDCEKLRIYLDSIATRSSGVLLNKATNRPIKALVPMHTFGHASNIEALMSIANDFGLLLIEDAAESIGSTYKEKHTGTFGLMGALSFNGNKTITSGGGGAILVSDEDIAIRAKHITRTARIDHRWEYNHDEIGYNFRMPNINAALGLAQLEQLQGKLMRKRKLFEKYYEVFSSIEGITLFKEPENCTSNYWLQAIILNELNENLRDTILEVTNDVGITTRPSWRLLTNLTPYRYHPRMELTVASSLASRIINIPSSPNLIVD